MHPALASNVHSGVLVSGGVTNQLTSHDRSAWLRHQPSERMDALMPLDRHSRGSPHRKIWARLRAMDGIRVSRKRVL
jgi:hypothetical protein